MFCRPTELIMPAWASHSRGAGLPSMGSRDRPFTTIPPSLFRSTMLLELDAIAEGSGRRDHRIA